MQSALNSKYLVTKISDFLYFNDIISFKKSGNKINIRLNPETNEGLNERFLYDYLLFFRNEDDDDYYDIKIGEIIYDANNEIRKVNWQEKIKEINESKEKMMILLDKKANEILDFIYSNHIYLPDLRKNNYTLEFSNSSIFMLKLYDLNKQQRLEKCYYEKYITEEYIFSPTENKKIIPLREKLYYEKELLNIRESFKEIKENERYFRILNEQIMENNYELIIKEFKDASKEDLKQINPIICFIYLMTAHFKLYLINVKASIMRFKNYPKKEKYLKEFIKQHNDVMNVILFINSNFNNANIIINHWNKFINKNNKETGEKNFSLLILLLNMYKEKVFNNIINEVIQVFFEYLKEKPKKEEKIILKENKMVIEDNDINMASTDDNSYCSSDEKSESDINDEEFECKKIIEDLGNCILDIELNSNSACGINHTKVKLGENYNKYENVLIDIAKMNIEKCLKENEPLKAFEEMKNLLEADKSPRMLKSKNIKIINRIKKKLVQTVTSIFIEYTRNNFDISNKFNYHNLEMENYDEFSEDSERKIRKNIENEINIIKDILKQKHKNLESAGQNLEKIVNEYVDNNGDSIVILAKKAIYFFYKEMQFYKDNDKIIVKMLKKSNMDSCIEKK